MLVYLLTRSDQLHPSLLWELCNALHWIQAWYKWACINAILWGGVEVSQIMLQVGGMQEMKAASSRLQMQDWTTMQAITPLTTLSKSKSSCFESTENLFMWFCVGIYTFWCYESLFRPRSKSNSKFIRVESRKVTFLCLIENNWIKIKPKWKPMQTNTQLQTISKSPLSKYGSKFYNSKSDATSLTLINSGNTKIPSSMSRNPNKTLERASRAHKPQFHSTTSNYPSKSPISNPRSSSKPNHIINRLKQFSGIRYPSALTHSYVNEFREDYSCLSSHFAKRVF